MKSRIKKLYGIIFLLAMFLVVPKVNAAVEISDLSYSHNGQDVYVEYVYGMGDGGTDFIYPKEFSYESTDYSFIDEYLLEQSDYKLSLKLEYFEDEYEEITASDTDNWNVVVKFDDETVYSGRTTIEELKAGKTIELDLSSVSMNHYYNMDVEITLEDDSTESMYTAAGCKDESGFGTYCGQYHEFFVGSVYGIKFESKIDDTYGTSRNGSYIDLNGFFDAFESFTYSFTLTIKENGATYTLKKSYCTYADAENPEVSSSDTCTVVDSVENADLNTKYFDTTVTKSVYDSELADVDYIKFTIYNGSDKVVDKIYYLEHEVLVRVEFATYTITDKTGHDVLSDKIANSKTVTVNLKGINFKEDETYYVSFYVDPEEYSENAYDNSFRTYTGKQLNDGISVDVTLVTLKDLINMSIYSNCAYNCEAEGCDSEDAYQLWLDHYSDEITVADLTGSFESTSVKNLTATGTNYNRVELNFDSVNGATGYRVYRSTKKSSGYKLLGTTEYETYVDKTANVKTTYYYRVRAYNDDTGERIYSKYSSVKSAKAKLHKPTEVSAKSYNYNSVKISYGKVDGATGYAIYRATSKNGTYKLVKYTTSTSYRDTKLTTGKTYYYKVRAYRTLSGKKYYSSYSTYTSAKPTVSTPKISATGYDYNINKITVTNSPSGVTGYAIYRMDPESAEQKYELIGTTTKKYYYDKGLETGKVYYYKVRAYRTVSGSKKYGSYSTEKASAGVVRAVKFTVDNSSSKDSLTINITKANGATGYYIYKDSEKIADVTALTYKDENVEYGKEYTYKVQAYRTVNGENVIGVNSADVIVTVKPATPKVTITNAAYNKQIVNLSSSEIGETDTYTYYLYRSTSKTKGFTKIYEGTDSSVEVPSLSFNKAYYYYAVIKLNDVESNSSAIVGKKTALTRPTASAKYASKSSIKVSWDKIAGAKGYQVYRATSKTGKYTLVKTTTATSFTNKSLTTGKTYYYKVIAYRVVSGKKVYSSFSTVVSDKPRVKVPKFEVTATSETSNKIVITKVSGASGYRIYRSEAEDGPYTTLVTTTKTTYTDKKVEAGKTYYYKVRAYSLVGKTKKYGDASAAKTITQTVSEQTEQ